MAEKYISVTPITLNSKMGVYLMAKVTRPEDLLPLTPIAFHILLAVSDDSRHGYGIMKEVERMTEGKLLISAGTLYNAIKRLLRDMLIKVVDEEPAAADDPRRTRYYRITILGQRTLEAEYHRLEETVRVAQQKPVLGRFGILYL
jgi:DNA-binding PadR family transcriptional regulator